MLSLIKDAKGTTNGLKTGKHRKMLCLFVMLAFTCLVWQKASALDKLLYQESASVFVGGTTDLRSYISEEFLELNYSGDYNAADAAYSISYDWNEQNLEPACATLDSNGTVTAIAAGSAKVDITFTYNDIKQTEVFTVEVCEPEQVNITYGESASLLAAQIYDTGKYMYTSSDEGVVINSDGSVTAHSFNSAKIYVSVDDSKKVEVAQVNVAAPAFSAESQTRAVGALAYTPEITGYTPFEGDEAIKWEIADETVVAATNGGIMAMTTGETDVTAVIKPEKGDAVKITTKITATDPVVSENDIVIATDVTKNITIDGLCETSVVEWNIGISSEGCAYFKKEGKLYASSVGEDIVTINVDGKDIDFYITVTDPYYDEESITTYKGASDEIIIEGIDESISTVTFKSKKKAVADVDEYGAIEAKKVGSTVIVANADGRKIEIPVEVASLKGYKAAQKAISISNTKTRYSQAKRMSKGYYDCSSLIWRIYSQYDVYFGVSAGWAPTAAEIAKWCTNNGKKIYDKAVSSDKLLPGDLVFFSYAKNGRYKNISHVEMYTGQDMDVSASSSNNRVIHYEYSQNKSIVMIARPVK